MTRLPIVTLALCFVLTLVSSASAADPTLSELLEKAIYTEQTVGDLDAAVNLYEQIAAKHELNAETAARAQLHLGMARLKRGDRAKATEAFRILVDRYPSRDKIVKYAENQIPPDLDEALHQIRNNYVDVLDDEDELMAAAIRGVLGELDEYSGLLSAEAMDEFKVTLSGRLVGIGVAIALQEGRLVVTTPIVGSPAFEAGLLAGDTIATIDNTSVASIPEDERLKEAVRRLRGKADTAVTVGIISPNSEKARDIRIVRRPLKLDTIVGNDREDSGTWRYELSKEPKIDYLAILSFGREAARDLRTVVAHLEEQGSQAIVIDLRNSPGGLMKSAIDCADLFLNEGVIVEVRGRNQNETHRAKPTQFLAGVPIAILTNSATASAAEIFAGALRDHHRAVIVGERTHGKGSVQSLITLKSGNAIKLTTARFYLPNGRNIQKPSNATEEDVWGISPSEGFGVELSEEERRAYGPLRAAQASVEVEAVPEFSDRVLEKAMEYLTQQTKE
ncbi:MAG: PDZ domain-containing protein [Planctomycetes bacterium]|nr:PDZ domain-containing protein [Planctomycetota bacterium]